MFFWPYLVVFLGSLLIDCIPVFAPPAWTLMVFMMSKYDLNPWVVTLLGAVGTVSGRAIFMTFIVPWAGEKTLSKDKREDLTFLGEKLSEKGFGTFLFVFAYSILPLSTTALFTAAGLGKVKRRIVIPPFFMGNLIGDGLTIFSGKYVIDNAGEMFSGSWDLKSVFFASFGLLIVLAILFIDWRTIIKTKKLKLKIKFWK